MKLTKLLVVAALFFSALSLSHAAELVGNWTAEFDSQIGVQKYKYEFKSQEGKLTGKATYNQSMGQGTVDLKNISVHDDVVSFSETLNINGGDLTITYAGKIKGDEMSLTRTVGEFGTEEIVAKRVKDPVPETKPAASK